MGPTLSRAKENGSGLEKQAGRLNGMKRMAKDEMEQPWAAEGEEAVYFSFYGSR